jgi:integrase/recombinase XerD
MFQRFAQEMRCALRAFRKSPRGRERGLDVEPLGRSDVCSMIRRYAKLGCIRTELGWHDFRATGITAYLKTRGRLEIAQHTGNESARIRGLYDRRGDEIALDEVERIGI